MQQYLYRIQPVRPAMLTDGPTAEEQQIVADHFSYLEQLTQERVVLLAGRTLTADYTSFGIIVFVANDDAAARLVVENDPAVQRRVMRAELFPFRIALLTELTLLASTMSG